MIFILSKKSNIASIENDRIIKNYEFLEFEHLLKPSEWLKRIEKKKEKERERIKIKIEIEELGINLAPFRSDTNKIDLNNCFFSLPLIINLW